jgi:hypothetical protein
MCALWNLCWDIDWLSGLQYGILTTIWINSTNNKIRSHEYLCARVVEEIKVGILVYLCVHFTKVVV